MSDLDPVSERLAHRLRQVVLPLQDGPHDYDLLLERIGDAHYVLIGEASHGTHDFYQARAQLTCRLIAEKGFTAVAVEADWPDAYRINRYVRGWGNAATPADALAGFERFPLWMWRNIPVLDFVGWLREHNDALPAGQAKCGFYGLDLYSLYTSIQAVLGYLDKVDPEAAGRARYRYSCLGHFGEDTQAYGYAASFGMTEPCEEEVVNQLVELQRRAGEYAGRDGRVAEDEFFYAEQNARLVRNAEQYYRTMFSGRVSSWNLRDRHMAETLERLVAHLNRNGADTRVVVWAHNSHLGDARATDMARRGELNVGQLVREHHGADALLIGFSTYSGTVTAASDWDLPPERKRVRPGLPGSFEQVFHDVGRPRFLLDLRQAEIADLRAPRLQRAIGVIYRPESERVSHYFHTCLPEQFDLMFHLDQTRALDPLDPISTFEPEEVPDTYPSGQ